MFKKGEPRPENAGRKPGSTNKSTGFKKMLREVLAENEQLFKDTILEVIKDKNERRWLFEMLERLEPKEIDGAGIKRLEIEYVE